MGKLSQFITKNLKREEALAALDAALATLGGNT